MLRFVTSLVFSKLDYCNAVLVLLRSTIAPLQRVQNAAACLVARPGPRDHVIPTLKDRHWRPIKQRTVFKLQSTDAPSSYWTSSILSAKLRHRISRHDLTSSFVLHQRMTVNSRNKLFRESNVSLDVGDHKTFVKHRKA